MATNDFLIISTITNIVALLELISANEQPLVHKTGNSKLIDKGTVTLEYILSHSIYSL